MHALHTLRFSELSVSLLSIFLCFPPISTWEHEAGTQKGLQDAALVSRAKVPGISKYLGGKATQEGQKIKVNRWGHTHRYTCTCKERETEPARQTDTQKEKDGAPWMSDWERWKGTQDRKSC